VGRCRCKCSVVDVHVGESVGESVKGGVGVDVSVGMVCILDLKPIVISKEGEVERSK